MRLPLTACLMYRATLAVSMLGLGLTACASHRETPTTARPQVYVLNFYGAEEGRAEQRPRDLVLSEFTTINAVTWQSWGPTRAVGRGKLSGMWGLPECGDAPYDATVTLGAVVPVRGKGYFSRYAVTARLPDDQRKRADLTGRLPIPGE